ncbi:MAG: response regulator [Chloroflexota bacterium]|nr:response regulator [Chloroflexota bacterium]
MIAKRILVVDDEPSIAELCAKMLKPSGFEVQGVTDGAEAIALYKSRDFDLALVDLHMPGVSGLQVLATIKEYDPSAAVVIFTAYGTKESAVTALRLGACEFLEKPLSTKTLVATVRRILEREGGPSVQGNLHSLSLPSIIQINCTERNQAHLRLRRRGQEGSIFFADGNIVHAASGSQVGEETVYELLTWEYGDFELEMGVPPPEQTITTNWSGLLLEGMRRIDERTAKWKGLDELEKQEEINEMAKLDSLLKEMASEIPGFIAAGISGMDGLAIASYSVVPEFDIEMASAQFALVMKLVQKTVGQMGDVVEDNLVTANHAYMLVYLLGDGSYWLGMAVDKDTASLGNVRLMARNYATDLWQSIPRREK